MTDKMESYIVTITHPVEDIAQDLQIVLSNYGFSQAEMDGWHLVIELDGFDILFNNFAHLRSVPLILFKYGRVMDPWGQRLFRGHVHFHPIHARIRFPYPCFHA